MTIGILSSPATFKKSCSDLDALIPNPATKYITVASLSQNPAEYTIYNSNGVVLKHGILIEGANQIDVEKFKPGMYLIRSEAGYSKFIKL